MGSKLKPEDQHYKHFPPYKRMIQSVQQDKKGGLLLIRVPYSDPEQPTPAKVLME